ncbi:MAG: FAD-dependent oxidoreductase, partial [Deltaproteobacteria bacterium]|nr:FAD-dependent oxidoreductase [Deltaproteobacteria bacterium]
MRSDANIFIHRDKCFVCGVCVERCILDNLRMYLAPCRASCPIHMNCQGYVRLIALGKEEEAAKEMRKDLPFGGIVGRVCHHPCEERCERKKVDPGAVHIRALKRYLVDQFPQIAYAPDPVPRQTGKRSAIVGSGPAGLMAAYELARQGHGVALFEADGEPGGMLRWGIPSFRLPAEEIGRAIGLLEKMNVTFLTRRALGKDLDLEKLEREWDAVFVATGGGSPARLRIPGEELENVYLGLNFLRSVREGKAPQLGKSSIVVGGGNTAFDAALVCRKLGVDEVTVICLEDREKMPAFAQEIDEALEEGVKIQNGWGLRKIIKRDDPALRLEISRCLQVFDEQGKFSPVLDNVAGLSASVDSVILAIGQTPDASIFPVDMRSNTNLRIGADPLTLQTRRLKIFAGGDAVFGPQSVIEAMAQGREAAISINRMLQGETLRWGRAYADGISITDFPIDRSGAVVRPRARLMRVAIPSRDLQTEIEQTLSPKEAREEAERC